MSRGAGDQITLTLGGKHLDISGLMPGLGALGSEEGKAGSPMTLTAAVDRLTLRPGLDLRSAELVLMTSRTGLETVTANGIAGDGAPLVASIEVKRRGDVRRAKLYYLRERSGKSARIKEKLPAKKVSA